MIQAWIPMIQVWMLMIQALINDFVNRQQYVNIIFPNAERIMF